MIHDLIELLIPLLGFGTIALGIAAALIAGVVNNVRIQRALEYRMAERIALIQRGINPQTLAPLTNRPGEDAPA
jgi:hypothetical protein